MRPSTFTERRRVYLLARVLVARHYRRALTTERVAAALSCSARQLQRVYAQFGELTFQEDLTARRMAAAVELLTRQAIPVSDVARLVGYGHRSHFARVFAARYGISPARFRERERAQRAARRELEAADSAGVGSGAGSSGSASARGR